MELKDRICNLLKRLSDEANLWEGFDPRENLVESWPEGPASTINVGDLIEAREIYKSLKEDGDK